MWRVGRLAARRLPKWSVETRNFQSIAGIDREWFLQGRTSNMKKEVGVKKLKQVRRELTKYIDETTEQSGTDADELVDLFNASEKVHLMDGMVSVVKAMAARDAPISMTMYADYFRSLYNHKRPKDMLQVYDFLKKNKANDDLELTHRFHIVGLLMEGRLDEAYERYKEALELLSDRPTEIMSYMMLYMVEGGRLDIARELFDDADPQVGYWHETTIDRVLFAMGKAGEPDRAFAFYTNSSMRLTGGTLIALLRVCRDNDCKDQAAAILENRKRFELQLETKASNAVIETLEFLGQRDGIAEELADMKARNVPFNRNTRRLIDANQDVLPDYLFDESVTDQQNRMTNMTNSELDKRLAMDDLDGAMAIVNEQLVERFNSMKQTDGELFVHPRLSRNVVRTLYRTGQHDQVAKLVPLFLDGAEQYRHALSIVESLYGESYEHNEMVAQVTKGMMTNGDTSFRINLATSRFSTLGDIDGLYALYDYAIETLKDLNANKDKDKKSKSKIRNRLSVVQIRDIVTELLKAEVKNGELEKALKIIDEMQKYGWELRNWPHEHIALGMRQAHKKGVNFRTRDAAKVMRHMQDSGLDMTLCMVGNLYPMLEKGGKDDQMLLLEMYEKARQNTSTSYILPYSSYSSLVRCAASARNRMERLRMIEADADATRSKQSHTFGESNFYTELLFAYANENAYGDVKRLYRDHGSQSFTPKAIFKFFEVALTQHDSAFATEIMGVIRRDGLFLQLGIAYRMMHLCRQRKDVTLIMDVMERFEAMHVDKETNELIEDVGRKNPGKWVRVISMYKAALIGVEETGDWKKALQVRQHIEDLLGVDVFDEEKRVKRELVEKSQAGEE